MNREEIIEYLNYLEKKFPVNDWKIDGVIIWPVIRVKLFFLFINLDGDSASLKTKKKTNFFYSLRKFIISLIYYIYYVYIKKSLADKMFCSASHFRHFEKGIYKNRYFNDLIDNQQDFLFLEYESTISKYEEKVDYPHKTLFIYKITYFTHALKKIKLYFHKTDYNLFPSFEQFESELFEKFGGKLKISLREVEENIIYLLIIKGIYKKILVRNNINKVYVLSYYSRLVAPMCLAANEVGIECIDIQHGGQGKSHVAYAKFSVVPKYGYQLLPQKFWCWDQGSADVINEWVSTQNYHQVKVVGNPWIEHCMKYYASHLSEKQKIILYTLQPIDDEIIESYIIDAIIKTPEDYIWWLRLHPRQYKEKEKLLNLLRDNKIYNKVNVEQATALPLPAILTHVYIHISNFSGSILEASMLKKKSIILSELGVLNFPDVVKSEYGIVLLNKSSEELLDEIIDRAN
ncbi:hypothetical protein [uncultured Pontibacter sp.]|uniref:hypothetical protein n=1 Tax=uncultured Pontibacter sp. TaxID=453356 RepID=UPI002606B86E|nr:hypothetical protein [uncultured Pontibacter sp.]